MPTSRWAGRILRVYRLNNGTRFVSHYKNSGFVFFVGSN